MTRIDYESSISIVLSFAFLDYIMKLYFTMPKTILIIIEQMGV